MRRVHGLFELALDSRARQFQGIQTLLPDAVFEWNARSFFERGALTRRAIALDSWLSLDLILEQQSGLT